MVANAVEEPFKKEADMVLPVVNFSNMLVNSHLEAAGEKAGIIASKVISIPAIHGAPDTNSKHRSLGGPEVNLKLLYKRAIGKIFRKTDVGQKCAKGKCFRCFLDVGFSSSRVHACRKDVCGIHRQVVVDRMLKCRVTVLMLSRKLDTLDSCI